MALIACPQCSRRVSPIAASCPGCGHPVGNPAGGKLAGGSYVTTQRTGKRFKLQRFAALLLLAGALLPILLSIHDVNAGRISPGLGLAAWIGVGAFAWLAVTNVRIWWSHR